MEYRVLGPLEVRKGEESLRLAGAKQRALLALLLVHANHVLSRDRLIDELWGDHPPETALQSLQVYVSRLRKLLPPDTLLTRAPGYLLEIEPEELDLHRFERLLAGGRSALAEGDAERAAGALHQALALWRGPALAEFAFEPFAQAEIGRLEDLRLAAVEERIEADLALGRHADLIGELEALVDESPYRERLRGQLMLAFYRSGRQAEALAVFADARARLVGELGIEPGRELRELQLAILEQRNVLDYLLPVRPRRVELPTPPTPIVGRERELGELERLLGERRLVTLVGVGGSGKTRLAIEAAERVAESFPDGVFWVGLQALDDPALVLATVAQALEVRAHPNEEMTEALKRVLHDRTLLLLVDNAEHVLDGASALGELLAHAGGLKVLATSRERLGLGGEWEYAVEPLEADAAAELFVGRAAAVRSQVEVDKAIAAEICSRVDRLPLAIELAAALVRMLDPAEILVRLEHRLAALTEGPRDAPARQRTLRATIAWSYGLLSQEERRGFSRLSVFAGSFSPDAAETVCGAEVDTLRSLVERSLVRRLASGRLMLLETIREYAAEELGRSEDVDDVAHRHAQYFGEFVRRAGVELAGKDQEAWYRAIEVDYANVRDAFGHLAVHDRAQQADCAVALWNFWTVGGHLADGRRWFDAAAWAPAVLPAVRMRALAGASHIARLQGDLDAADRCSQEHRRLAEVAGDKHEIASAFTGLANIATSREAGELALALQEQAAALHREVGDQRSLAFALNNLAYVYLEREEWARAIELLEEALDLQRQIENLRGECVTELSLAAALLFSARRDDALAMFLEALRACVRLGHREYAAYAFHGLAAAGAETDPHGAALLLGTSEHLLAEVGVNLELMELRVHDLAVDAVRSSLGADAEPAKRAGRELAFEAAVERALSFH